MYQIALLVVCVLCVLQIVYSVRMNIQPSSVTVGGQTGTTPFPTMTPAEVVMDCSLGGNAEAVYALYMKRKRVQDNDFVNFAELHSHTNNAALSQTAPADIRSKLPELTGSTSTSDARLTARFQIPRLSCQDEAMYQCSINYKPFSSPSRIENATSNLTVAVLATQFSITASRTGATDAFPSIIQNSSVVDINTDLEFTCKSGIGQSPSTMIDWYWKTNNNLNLFTRYSPPNLADINQGNPVRLECSYERTSTLRYRFSSADWQGVVFRCEVAIPSNTGIVTSYSPEFHIRPGGGFQNMNSGRPTTFEVFTSFVCIFFCTINQHFRHC